ncbi:hypothetical protein [Aridibaculum aurantiacum]|uniref:hypothetical protein n=1 Tax=Aridibaculum aurantiacum TaxID=2810307 RepID=UPI001A97BF1E|nr:hypothetical protein [Aridibaculum aurantiacum]
MNEEKEIEKKKLKLQELEEQNKKAPQKGDISSFFGANPDEVDGEEFQQQVRKEWQ